MVISIVVSVIIGAIIGGFTNLIAIRMLFRPYRQWHIGRWNVPLTPGLIPKRHEELATQLGQLVTNHLLTSQGIKGAVETRIKNRVLSLVIEKLDRLFESDKNIKELISSWMGEERTALLIEDFSRKTNEGLASGVRNILGDSRFRSQTWGELAARYVEQEWEYKAKEAIASAFQKGLIRFVESGGLKQPLQQVISQFTGGGQGMFGKLASMFVDESKISASVEPRIIEYLTTDSLKNRLIVFLDEEWEQFKKKQIGETLDKVNVNTQLEQIIEKMMGEIRPLEYVLHTKISLILQPYRSVFMSTADEMMERIWDSFMTRLDTALSVLELDQVVKNEVLAFPLPKLEHIIVEIAGKELKLITLLGALLGGVIGIIQGILFYILNK